MKPRLSDIARNLSVSAATVSLALSGKGRVSNEMVARIKAEDALGAEGQKTVTLDQQSVGRLSRIDSLQNQGLTRNLQERERAKWGLLVAALRRMENGTYGVCTECDRPIPFGRLLVMPEAATCAECVA